MSPTGQVEKMPDGLGIEKLVGFLDGFFQLLFAAEDDVFLLHVGATCSRA